MKKFILMLALFSACIGAKAQIATENSKLLDNTYIGVGVAATSPLNFNSTFPVNPSAFLKIGKELTPVFGLEVEGQAIFGDNFYRFGFNGSIPAIGAFNVQKNGSINTFVKATNVGLNSTVNLTNLFLGYNGAPRSFEIKTNTGLGWLHYFGNYTPTYPFGSYVVAGKNNAVVAKTAIDFAFNLGNTKASTITVSPVIYWNLNEANGIKFNKNYAQFGIAIGYTYHFKTSNGTRYFKTYDVGAMADEIGRLNQELYECENREPVVKIVEKMVEVPLEIPTDAEAKVETWTVTFETGKATLSDEAKYILNQVGNDAIVDVIATASPDGSAAFNQKLSEKRAKVVADYLTNKGVKVNSWQGKGVGETGRVAIVSTLQ